MKVPILGVTEALALTGDPIARPVMIARAWLCAVGAIVLNAARIALLFHGPKALNGVENTPEEAWE